MLNKCCDIPGFGDHQSAILADIECHPKKQKPISRKIYLWNEANHELLRETIQQNVESFIATNDIRTPVNTLWEKFSFFVSNTQDKYVPSKMSSVRYSLLWSTSHCKKLVRKKKKLYQKAKKSKLGIDWNKYRSAAPESRKACRHAYNVFIKNCLYENNNSNTKRLYSYIKNKQVDNFGEGPLKDNDKVSIEGKDKARISNSKFPSVFSTENGDIPLIETQYANSSISNIDINTEGIIKLLNQLNPNKASGPDNISARLLKETSSEIAPALALVFQASLYEQSIPDDWRKANVTPIYKPAKKIVVKLKITGLFLLHQYLAKF